MIVRDTGRRSVEGQKDEKEDCRYWNVKILGFDVWENTYSIER